MKNIKWLCSYLNKMRWFFLLSIIFAVIEGLLFLATIGLQKQLIDEVIIGQNNQLFYNTVILMAITYTVYSIMFGLIPHFFYKNMSRLREMITADYINRLYRFPINKLQQERTGRYVNYATQDIMNIGEGFGVQLPRGIQNLISSIFMISFIGIASPLILFMVISLTLVYIFLGYIHSSKMQAIGNQVQNNKANVLVNIEEGISSTREVIAYHRQEWERAKYENAFDKYFKSTMEEGKAENRYLLLSEPFKWIALLFVLGYGGYLVFNGELSIGTFIVMFQFTSLLTSSLQTTFNTTMDLSGKMAHVNRMRLVMSEDVWTEEGMKINDRIQQLEFDHVYFKYDEKNDVVLDQIHFQIPIGSKIALVGPSGGGKSTIAQLLIRFFEPTSGEIRINGIPLNRIMRSDYAKRVDIVFQEPYLFPDTIRNNLMMGASISDEKLQAICQSTLIHDDIMRLPNGYETKIGERGITLSGGQRQRLALARVLLRNPEILILDEATSALDLETERQVQQNIDLLRQGKTTIIIAHRLSTIMNADLIMTIRNGRIAEKGTHNELMQYETEYRSLVEVSDREILPKLEAGCQNKI